MALVGTVVKEFVIKNPKMPYRQMATILYKKNPEMFNGSEHARSIVRYYTGAHGKKKRLEAKDKAMFQPLRNQSYGIPQSHAPKKEVFVMPKGVTRLGILSDIHLPYHDEQALSVAVEYLKGRNINGLLLNGDTLDFYGLSTHEKDPRKRKFGEELECFKEFIKWIKQELDCPIYYKIGNHEYRYERWMMHKAPELLDIPNFKLEEVLEFGANGIIKIESMTKIQAGKLNIYHGHEFKGSGGVNPARWLSLKAKVSSCVGHFHRSSEFVWRDSNGSVFVCYSFGALCDLSPEYLPENDWNHSVQDVEIDPKSGEFKMTIKKIINGKIY